MGNSRIIECPKNELEEVEEEIKGKRQNRSSVKKNKTTEIDYAADGVTISTCYDTDGTTEETCTLEKHGID